VSDDGRVTAESEIVGSAGMMRPGRMLSVDMLRGVTVALMLLVNDPGDW